MQSATLARLFPLPVCLLVASLLNGCATTAYAPPASTPVTTGAASHSTAPQTVAKAPAGSSSRKGGGYYLDDGPEDTIPSNLDSVPDAVPRAEPLRPAANRPYTALGTAFTPLQSVQPFSQTGMGTWYGKKFNGAKTSSGEKYDMYSMTAAHPTLPIPSYARVTNLSNGRSVIVRVNDRGPFLRSRIIDLSYVAAWKLGYINQGSAKLQVDAIVPDELDSFIASNTGLASTPTTSATPSPAPAAVPAPTPTPPSGSDVSPAPATAAAAPLPVSGVFLQLGAFNSANNADNFREYVQNELKWLQQEIHTELIGDRYRLRVGPFRNTDEARSVSERIASRLRVQPFLVQR